jgi:hypothetical protein
VKLNWFKLFLLGSIIILAGSAAFFSVYGMAYLFKSQFISIIILGLGLEAAKFTATIGLHRLWNRLNKFLKTYLFTGVVALSIITSLGIYGFLSSAYTVSKAEYSIDEGKIQNLESIKNKKQEVLVQYNDRLKRLNDTKKDQEQRLNDAVKSTTMVQIKDKEGDQIVYNDKRAQQTKDKMIEISTKAIENANVEYGNLIKEYDATQQQILSLETQILENRQQQAKNSDILTFKFIADGLGLDLDRTVRYFILILIFVFDPMALALVLLYQYFQKNRLNNVEVIHEPQIIEKHHIIEKPKIIHKEKEKVIFKEQQQRGMGM